MRNTEARKSHVEAHNYLDADVPQLDRTHHRRRRILERRGFITTPLEKLPASPPAARPAAPSAAVTTPRPAPAVAEVRAWAGDQNMDVPPRGKLRQEIWDAWHTAHPDHGQGATTAAPP
ncbi:Lsr2 family DNA-binding protein [Streptomyces hyaluromycini]|uniref:Lsr2 family DNA-binding protein n=1 Tax=Streptomyces hyaluromycini TaxID=1377993 RepID=UPI000B5CAD70|nr:Lsr2 family protein [Streptomyces hyaluromycini]